jgi:hypothetical protein
MLKQQIWTQSQVNSTKLLKNAIENGAINFDPAIIRAAFDGVVHCKYMCIQVNLLNANLVCAAD